MTKRKTPKRKPPVRKEPDRAAREEGFARIDAATRAFLDDVAYEVKKDRAARHERVRLDELKQLYEDLIRSTRWNHNGKFTQTLSIHLAARLARIAVEGCVDGRYRGPDVPPYRDDDMEGG